MENKSVKSMTVSQFNIIGQKIEINIEKIKENIELEEIMIKNFEIRNNFIDILNSLNKLKKVSFINCIFYNDIKLEKITYLKIENCKNINLNIFNNNIDILHIANCNEIDINSIKNLDLKVLHLENERIINLKQIENFVNIEELYLQEIQINEQINYNSFPKLNAINLDGSIVENKLQYLKQFESKNIRVSFYDKNLKIE